jgi:hypothetical protein
MAWGWIIAVVMLHTAPINRPPAKDARVPNQDMPPLVPAGTVRRQQDVISRGGCSDRIPNSLAHVSPLQQL